MRTARRRAMVAALPVALLAVLSACTGANTERFRGPQIDSLAPAYAAATLAGDTVSLEDLRGSVVLLNFWATWCAPCRHETPFLQSIYEENVEAGLEVVGVSMDTGGAEKSIADFVEEYGVTYTILHDVQGRAESLYQIVGLPGTFLINRDGTLRWMRYGPVGETDTDFLQALSDALQQP